MLKAGLPPVMTLGTEISRQVEENRLGLVSPIGDPNALAANLLRASRDPEELAEMAKRSREFFLKHYALEATSEPFLNWAEKPWFAPDHRKRSATGMNEFKPSMARQIVRRLKHVIDRRS